MIYYGNSGRAVGSWDGDWVFDVDGQPMYYVFERNLYSSEGVRAGAVVSGGIYDKDNRLVAFGEKYSPTLLPSLKPKLAPLMPALRPIGVNISEEPSIELPPALATAVLCSSLSELSV